MSRPELVAEAAVDLSPPLRVDGDLARLRIAYSGLMDEVNARVRQLGLDTDDCVVERYAVLSSAGGLQTAEVSLESLTDPSRIVKSFRDNALRGLSSWDEAGVVAISRLRLVAIRTPDFPPPCERRP